MSLHIGLQSLKKLLMVVSLAPGFLFADVGDPKDATIPVLDGKEYFHPETKERFVKQLYDALKDVGFFAVINTGVDPKVLEDAFGACYGFFALPQEKKLEMFDPEIGGERGYTPGESAKGQTDMDFKEFYSAGRELDDNQRKRLNLSQNVWPQDCRLKKCFCALYAALEKQKVFLEQAMAEAIGESSDFFTKMTCEGDTLLRAIHYPASPPKNQFWSAAHTDIGLFTLLPGATAEGLQVCKNGEWIDVKIPENAFIVNAGDMLENVTNGEFRSVRHRVKAKDKGYERYSIVFFVHPRSEAHLDPLSSCVARTGGVRRYANATRLELLEERLVDLQLASYPMMCHLAESGFVEKLIEVGRASPDVMKKLREMGLASDKVLEELQRIEEGF